jgi:ribose transport system ATP-binding protein
MVLSCLPRLSRYGWLMRSVERRFSNDMAIRLGVRLHSLRDSIDSLSGGNQQKVILGRGLLSRPKVLLLDDSMRGIDVRSKDEIYRLLEELTDSGLSVIVNSTEIPELIALCPRVLVFHDHAVSAELVGSDVSEANILRGIFGRSAEKAA